MSVLVSGPSFTKDLSYSRKGTGRELEALRMLTYRVLCPFFPAVVNPQQMTEKSSLLCVKEGFPSVACVIKNHGVSFPLKQIWVIPSAPESPRKGDMFAHLKEKQVRRRKIDE